MPKTSQDKPTVGRIIWVWMTAEDLEKYGLEANNNTQPFRADVLYVNEQGLATIEVTDHVGSKVTLEEDVQVFDPEEDDGHEDAESYATWMPYQQKKHAQDRFSKDFADAKKEEGA
jgi:hypothetical protein